MNGVSVTETITFNLATYNVSFSESGLPSGTKWYVNLTNGQTYSSTTNTITFQEPNGTYDYTVSTVNKEYSPTPSSGSLNVSGKNVNQNVVFNLVTYYAIFTETGLPSNVTWYVNISNNGISEHSDLNNILISLPNGTYYYKISTINKSYYPVPSGGNFTIKGKNIYISIKFILKTYNVSFEENNLPNGTLWYLKITGNGINKTFNSTNRYINISLPNGTYTYIPSSNNSNYSAIQRSFIINGSSQLIIINFTFATYEVVFYVINYTKNVKWYINLSNNQSFNSTDNSLIIYVYRGNYYFNVSVSNKNYYILPNYGTFTVINKSLKINLEMYIKYYNLTVTETGLPNSIKWYFNITNYAFFNTTNNEMKIKVPNGTYYYNISTNDKNYRPSQSTGIFVINGRNDQINISFIPVKFLITFNAINLPPGITWYVNISGINFYHSNNSRINFYLFNGTYYYNISSQNKSYKPNFYSGILNVNGSSISINVTFLPVLYSVKFTEYGLPQGLEWYVSIGNKTIKTYSNIVEFQLFNGTYKYYIDNIINITSSERLFANQSNGYINVNGKNITVDVIFRIQYYLTIIVFPSNSAITNISSEWVTINSTIHIGIIPINKYKFIKWEGYGKGNYSGYNQNISIKMESAITEKAILNLTYQVKIIEYGLPNGTYWYVSIQNYTISTNNTFIPVNLINGTYNLIFFSSNKDFIANNTTMEINGKSENISVYFYLLKFPVYVVENLTDQSVYWGIKISGPYINQTIKGYNSTLIAYLPNGTFNLYIISPEGYHVSSEKLTVNISGEPVKISVYFIINKYLLNITIFGIKNTTKWQLYISGKTFNGQNVNIFYNFTGSTAQILIPNGTYNIKIISNTFSLNESNLNINISGKNLSIKVSTNQPYSIFYIIIPVILILILLFILYRKRKKPEETNEEEIEIYRNDNLL